MGKPLMGTEILYFSQRHKRTLKVFIFGVFIFYDEAINDVTYWQEYDSEIYQEMRMKT
jgi:hypothetical protein